MSPAAALTTQHAADSVAIQADDSEGVTSTTSITLLNSPVAYGDGALLHVRVRTDGPSFPHGVPVQIEVDGVIVANVPLIFAGPGDAQTISFLGTEIPAGTHSIVARFPGMDGTDPFASHVRPSVSDPLEIVLERAATSTEIVSAPSAVRAFERFDVDARVTSGVAGIDGRAALLADGEPLAEADVAADGGLSFRDVVAPPGTAALGVAYLGDAADNYALSASEPHVVEVTEIDTTTSLTASATSTRADVPVNFTATVTSIDSGATVEPRGEIQLRIDGVVERTIPIDIDADPAAGDGTARVEIEVLVPSLGDHLVSASFVPLAGFTPSESEALSVSVHGVETVLSAGADRLTGTPTTPPLVDVVARVAPFEAEASAAELLRSASTEEGLPADGRVQAFVGEKPLSEPIAVEAGHVQLPLPGLALGDHEVQLRFTPENETYLPSTAVVSVSISPDVPAEGEADGGSEATGGDSGGAAAAAHPAALVRTGGVELSPFVALAGIFAILVGAIGLQASSRRRNQ